MVPWTNLSTPTTVCSSLFCVRVLNAVYVLTQDQLTWCVYLCACTEPRPRTVESLQEEVDRELEAGEDEEGGEDMMTTEELERFAQSMA